MRYMLDTNICIHVMRRSPPTVIERFDQEAGAICISSVTLGELLYGAEKSSRPAVNSDAAAKFAQRLEVLSYDQAAAAAFGEIRAALERAGTPCGPYDMMIGAHARSADLTLVTNNRREFDRMPGLRVENWL